MRFIFQLFKIKKLHKSEQKCDYVILSVVRKIMLKIMLEIKSNIRGFYDKKYIKL